MRETLNPSIKEYIIEKAEYFFIVFLTSMTVCLLVIAVIVITHEVIKAQNGKPTDFTFKEVQTVIINEQNCVVVVDEHAKHYLVCPNSMIRLER